MFCKKCGAAVSDGDAFCPKCGTRVEKEETVTPVSYNESNSEHTEEQTAPAKEIKEKCCNRISVVLESISRCLRPDDQSHKIDFLKISWSRIALRVLYNVSGGW